MDEQYFKDDIWAIPAAVQGCFTRFLVLNSSLSNVTTTLCLFIFCFPTVVKLNSEATSEHGHTGSPTHIYKWFGRLPTAEKTKILVTADLLSPDYFSKYKPVVCDAWCDKHMQNHTGHKKSKAYGVKTKENKWETEQKVATWLTEKRSKQLTRQRLSSSVLPHFQTVEISCHKYCQRC